MMQLRVTMMIVDCNLKGMQIRLPMIVDWMKCYELSCKYCYGILMHDKF